MKDTKDFNERFLRWKNGENYWEMRGVSLNTNSDRPATKEQVELIKSRLAKFLDGKDDGKNVFRNDLTGDFFYQANPDSEKIDLTPLNTSLGDDPALWTFTDSTGKVYKPKQLPISNQDVVQEAPNKNRLSRVIDNYIGELKYDLNNGVPVGGKYTMPAIAAVAALPLVGEATYPILTNPFVDAGLTSAFAAHGLNHTINEGINGWEDAAMTALELAPLGRLAKPMWSAGNKGINELLAMQNAAKLLDYNSQLEALNRFNVNPPSRVLKPRSTYLILRYPGWMLGSLMEGNPLEKLLSKTGTVSVNSIRAQAAKASKVDKSIIEDVLSSEQFANLKSVDYNDFRKAIQGRLIDYYRTPQDDFANYGVDRLGFTKFGSGPDINDARSIARDLPIEYPDRFEVLHAPFFGVWDNVNKRLLSNASDFLEYKSLLEDIYRVRNAMEYPELNTFTFRSPKVPFGNDTHYAETPVGHSRTYTLRSDPHTLYVMESLSDWGLHEIGTPKFRAEVNEDGVYNITRDSNGNYIYTEPNKGTVTKQQIVDSNYEILKQAKQNLMDDISTSSYDENIRHLHDDYQLRLIQENLRYAAENGQTKMRYPTAETAAKIEGYKKRDIFELEPDFEKTVKDIENRIYTEAGVNPDDYEVSDPYEIAESLHNNSNEEFISIVRDMGVKNKSAERDIIELLEKARRLYRTKYDYRPEHQTILRKYSAFPKLFKKLWKDLDVRTVTDNKGNTWYEVDVPKNFLNREWMYGMLPWAIGGSALYGTAELGDNYNKGKDAYENIRIPKKKIAKRK